MEKQPAERSLQKHHRGSLCRKASGASFDRILRQAALTAVHAFVPGPILDQHQAGVFQQMNQAMAAYKSGNLEDTVTRLQTLRAAPAISPQQRVAVNDATAAVMADIYARAAKGDAGAMQAVKQYEQMQTHSH